MTTEPDYDRQREDPSDDAERQRRFDATVDNPEMVFQYVKWGAGRSPMNDVLNNMLEKWWVDSYKPPAHTVDGQVEHDQAFLARLKTLFLFAQGALVEDDSQWEDA